MNSAAKPRPEKRSRADDISPTVLHRLINNQSIESKSIASEHLDKLGWNVHLSQVSDETISKIKDIVSDEVNALLLHALERGRLKLKPSRLDRGRHSPTESAKLSFRARHIPDGVDAVQDDEMRTTPETVATELLSPIFARDEVPEFMSEGSSP
jgi:hypothetical protein